MFQFVRGLLIIAIVLVASVAAAGDVTGSISGQNAVVWIEGKSLAATAPNSLTVSQRGVKFTPEFAVVIAGQTIEMPNDDNVAHNVYSLSPAKKFNLGVYAKGEARSVLFDTPGVVEMKCWLHKRMNATIVVVPNRFYALASNGAYRISGVPAGTYKVVVWRSDLPQTSMTVRVPASGIARADF